MLSSSSSHCDGFIVDCQCLIEELVGVVDCLRYVFVQVIICIFRVVHQYAEKYSVKVIGGRAVVFHCVVGRTSTLLAIKKISVARILWVVGDGCRYTSLVGCFIGIIDASENVSFCILIELSESSLVSFWGGDVSQTHFCVVIGVLRWSSQLVGREIVSEVCEIRKL